MTLVNCCNNPHHNTSPCSASSYYKTMICQESRPEWWNWMAPKSRNRQCGNGTKALILPAVVDSISPLFYCPSHIPLCLQGWSPGGRFGVCLAAKPDLSNHFKIRHCSLNCVNERTTLTVSYIRVVRDPLFPLTHSFQPVPFSNLRRAVLAVSVFSVCILSTGCLSFNFI